MGLVDLHGEEMVERIGVVFELSITWQLAEGGIGVFLRHVGAQTETTLQIVDMSDSGALCVVLQTTVDGGVNLKSIAVEVDAAKAMLAELLGEEARYLLAEVGSGAVIYLLYLIFTDVDGESGE